MSCGVRDKRIKEEFDMGRILTPLYELKIEGEKDCFLCIGVNSFREALEEVKSISKVKETGRAFLWGNSKTGKQNISRKGADFFQLDAGVWKPARVEIEAELIDCHEKDYYRARRAGMLSGNAL